MDFGVGIILSLIALLLVIIVFGTKMFFPYHRIIGLLIYILGWIPFIHSLSLRKQYILHYTENVTSFFHIYNLHLLVGSIMIVVIYVLLVLFPSRKSQFNGMSDKEIQTRLTEDQKIVMYLLKRITKNFSVAQKRKLFSVDFKNISQRKKDQLKDFWFDFIEIMIELDLLKERYKTFYILSPNNQKAIHTKAFKIGYLALVAQQYHTIQLTKLVKNQNLQKYLNQKFSEAGIQKNTYTLIQGKLGKTFELLRFNTGRAYYKLLNNEKSKINKKIDYYLQTIDSSLKSYSKLIAKRPLNFLEKYSFKLWFPIQKKAAIQMSYIRTSLRKYHISEKLIRKYIPQFQPGDILLERREWHATNIGIPGFWTHNALYIGTLSELDAYFNGISELKGKTFSDFLKKENKNAYLEFKNTDKKGNPYRIIEVMRPGVILNSLEESTNADSLAVLRVTDITKSEQFKVITHALSHLNKPYDYNFDFTTDEAFVCSELVYKSYLDNKKLTITPKKFNEKLIFPPNNYAEKFYNEYNTEKQELQLVLFLDGNERQRKAYKKDVSEFLTSWKRPKWHIAKHFLK